MLPAAIAILQPSVNGSKVTRRAMGTPAPLVDADAAYGESSQWYISINFAVVQMSTKECYVWLISRAQYEFED